MEALQASGAARTAHKRSCRRISPVLAAAAAAARRHALTRLGCCAALPCRCSDAPGLLRCPPLPAALTRLGCCATLLCPLQTSVGENVRPQLAALESQHAALRREFKQMWSAARGSLETSVTSEAASLQVRGDEKSAPMRAPGGRGKQ
eukprot:3172738-Prymnesium_polylepis.1